MKHRFIAILLCSVSLLGILCGYLLLKQPEALGLCSANAGRNCLSEGVLYGIAQPLYLSMWPFPFLFFSLAFVRHDIFYAWLKLFGYLLPIPILLVAAADPLPSGFFPGPFPSRVAMAALMAKSVVGISALYVAYAYWAAWRAGKKVSDA